MIFPELRTRHSYAFVWELAEKFSARTSIHGIQRVFSRSTGPHERLLWFVAFVTSLCLLVYVSLLVAVRYNSQQFETIIADPKYPIYKLPFPEVTVCNENRLNWSRLPEAKQKFLPLGVRHSYLADVFTDVVASYDTLEFARFSRFSHLARHPLHLLDYLNLTDVIQFMAWRCDEILSDCHWGRESYNCCDIFAPRLSQSGSCLAFNSVETPVGRRKQKADKYYPWHVSKAGPGTALAFSAHIREYQHYPPSNNTKGLTLMLAEPHVWFNYPTFLARNSKAGVSVDAHYIYHDEQTKAVPSKRRRCVFDYESASPDFKTFKGHKYMIENCQSKCQQDYLLKYCNCTMDLFFPSDSLPVCKAKDLPCLAKYNVYFEMIEQPDERYFVRGQEQSVAMQCDCFHNCNFLSYTTNLRAITTIDEYMSTNDSRIDLELYFKREAILVYRTQLVYTWVDLLVSFGGIAGLFLGCSVISIVEISYFCLMDVPKWVWHECRIVRSRHLTVKEASKRPSMAIPVRRNTINVMIK